MRPVLGPRLTLLLSLLVTYASAAPRPADVVSTAGVSLSASVKAERAWLWGWAWGAESTVSVVDRSPIVSFASRPADFGPEITDAILGYVIPLSSFTVPCASNASEPLLPSNTACPRLCISGPHQPDPSDTWIALVQRGGGCEFVKKVREAQRLGARAVVVGGEDPVITGAPDVLVGMYSPGDASDIKISSTFIRFSDYATLFGLISASNTSHDGLQTVSLLITAEYGAWEWYSPIITFIIILLLPSLLTFITLLVHRIRAARAAQRDRAPEDIVRNLPWRVWTGSGWEKHEGGEDPYAPASEEQAAASASASDAAAAEPESAEPSASTAADAGSTSQPPMPAAPLAWFDQQLECAICLCEFEKGDKVRVLPCHHIFHLVEVDEWLIQRKKLCPVCKADVTQPFPPPPHAEADPAEDAEAEASPSSRPASPDNATERTPLLSDSS